jgi:hypothetical protein
MILRTVVVSIIAAIALAVVLLAMLRLEERQVQTEDQRRASSTTSH